MLKAISFSVLENIYSSDGGAENCNTINLLKTGGKFWDE